MSTSTLLFVNFVQCNQNLILSCLIFLTVSLRWFACLQTIVYQLLCIDKILFIIVKIIIINIYFWNAFTNQKCKTNFLKRYCSFLVPPWPKATTLNIFIFKKINIKNWRNGLCMTNFWKRVIFLNMIFLVYLLFRNQPPKRFHLGFVYKSVMQG